jgi:cytochrome c553
MTTIVRTIVFATLSSTLLAFSIQPGSKNLKRGKELARYCTNCHGTTKGKGHYPLQGIRRFRTQQWLTDLVANPAKLAARDSTANKIFKKARVMMPAYPALSKDDINAIFDYLDSLPYDARNYGFRRGWKAL